MEQKSNSLRALQLALEHSRWRCGIDPKDPRILQARAPGRGYHSSLKFAFEEKQDDFDVSVVRVVDDTRSYRPGLFFQLEDLHPGDAVDGIVRIRLGHDILFPFLKSEGGGPLQSYARHVIDTYLSLSSGPGTGLNPVGNPAEARLSRLDPAEGAALSRVDVAASEIASQSRIGECALIAFDPLMDRNDFFYRMLFEPHVSGLTRTDDRKLARIPLFLSATDVRTLGLSRAMWEAGWQATSLALSSELMSLLIEFGFFHLYMPDIGSLRTDYDLDPNTQHIGGIFAAAGLDGSFTMGCERELVFQGPIFADAGTEKPFKTLGDRFFNAPRLKLYDSGPISAGRMHAELVAWGEFAKDQAERIARISESCLSSREVSEILIRIGAVDNQLVGTAFPERELERILRSILKGERLRPGNVRSAIAAMTNSGLFRLVAGGQMTMRSKVFASWLVSEGVFRALEALCYQADFAPLERALETANLPLCALVWAIAMGKDTFAEEVKEAIRPFLAFHRFRDGGELSRTTLIENLWTLLLVIAEMVHLGNGDIDGPAIIRDLIGTDVKFRSLALPQACFSHLDLEGWSFVDCRLRNASFLDCSLKRASMTECLLSGASFERCDFGRRKRSVNLKSFSGSDVSGAEFEACTGLAELLQVQGVDASKLLARSIWTASSVTLNLGEGNISAALRVLNEHSASAAGCRVAQALPSGKPSSLEVPWSASAARSLAHAQWGERPVTVKTPVAPDGLMVTKDSLVDLLSKSFKSGKGTVPTPGAGWAAVSCIADSFKSQILMAVDKEGQVWHALVEDDCCTWRIISKIARARQLAITRLANGDLVAALEHAEGHAALTFATLDRSGALKDSCPVELPGVGDICAMSWIDVQRSGKMYSELLVGQQREGACVLHHNSTQWQVDPFMLNLSAVTIDSFGYSPRENIAIACAQGGRVFGFRNIEAGRMEPLFSFHTAHKWFADVALLNHQGQMLVVGLTAGEAEKPPMSRNVLWALVQPFGNVVTIVSRSPEEGEIEPPIMLKPDSDSGERQLNDGQAARIEEISRSVNSLIQDRELIEVTPNVGTTVEFLLKVPEPHDERFELPESIDDSAGSRFRTISLVIKGKMPSNPSQEFERHYVEAEMDEVFIGKSQLRVRCTLQFHRGVHSESAALIVSYPSTDKKREINRSWNFTLHVEWEDNPFVSSGDPVSGDKFFGLENEIKDVLNAVQLGSNVIVRSCRRAGKSSFVQEVAQQLRARKKARVAIVVSGDRIIGNGNILPAVKAELRRIGELENRGDYRQLAKLDLPSDDTLMAFKLIIDEVRRRGLETPLTVFVDEWGYLKEEIGPQLANIADKLREVGVALCLTSTPGDFRNADSMSQSGDYRFFSHRFDIGRLKENALQNLIREPLARRRIGIDDDVVQAVVRLSSGAPHDANILMHSALNAAKRERDSHPSGNGSSGGLQIQLHHLLPRNGKPETEALIMLQQKYLSLQNFLIGSFKPKDRDAVLALAGEDSCPTVEEPNPLPTARWDIQPLGIPLPGEDRDRWRTAFADAGYRVALMEGEKTDYGQTAGLFAYKLWIPWGMAQYFRRLRQRMGGHS